MMLGRECLSDLLDDGSAIHGVILAEALCLLKAHNGYVRWIIFAEVAIKVMQLI